LLINQNPPPDAHVHLPNPSYYPLVAAIGLTLVAVGLLFDNPVFHIVDMGVPVVTALGALIMIGGIYGWSFEPAD
jgi:cytochrome c oxidase subunit 1